MKNVRGAGVMLGFDVLRADLCDALLDRAFRRGLVLLAPASAACGFYPRYDTEPSGDRRGARRSCALAIEDLVGGRAARPTSAPAVEDPRRHAGDPARDRRCGRC